MAPQTHEDLLARAEQNGYRRGAFEAVDSQIDRHKHVGNTERGHNAILKVYVTWSFGKIRDVEGPDHLTLDSVESQVLCKGAPAPSIVEVKDFFRFYIKSSTGTLTEHATVESTKSKAESFFAGFTRVTGTPTVKEERTEIYRWITQVLPAEGELVNVCKPKYNFVRKDLDVILLTLWASRDLKSISEIDRVRFTFLLHTYCWTGARISALFKGGGLKYKDVHLVLRRRAKGDGYELIWNIDQRWVKGNRDPNTVVFSAAGKEHSRLLYNDGALLLVLAFADNALFGFDSLDDFWQQEIPTGESSLILRWNDSVLEMSIARMSEWKFSDIFRSTRENAGYFSGGGVHQIRRALGKKVDKSYTEVERSQHILQSDPRVFGQSYVANTSSVDGQAAFLDEEADHSVVEYFQGLEQFRERGAPTRLPAARQAALEEDPGIVELEGKADAAKDTGERKAAEKALVSLRRSLQHKALVSFRQAWIRERRDWKILTRGKISPEVDTDGNQLNLILPERRRIVEKMEIEEGLSTGQMREAIQDLYTLIKRDYDVFYLPGEEPLNALCPVCSYNLSSYKNKPHRSSHIHSCRKVEKAKQLNEKPSSLVYCFDCTEWYIRGPKWDKHCQQHLSQILSKMCASIRYCNTVIKPAFCSICLGTDMPASLKMQYWDRDADVLAHIEKVHQTESCLHPLCQDKFEDKESFYYHQHDVHGYRRASGAPRKRKREEDTKQRQERPCSTSGHHILHDSKHSGWHDAAGFPSITCEDLNDEDSFGPPHSNKSADDFISQYIVPSTPSSQSSNSGEVAKTEQEVMPDGNVNNNASTVLGTESQATPKVRIKLNYRRPKIVLRIGNAQKQEKP